MDFSILWINILFSEPQILSVGRACSLNEALRKWSTVSGSAKNAIFFGSQCQEGSSWLQLICITSLDPPLGVPSKVCWNDLSSKEFTRCGFEYLFYFLLTVLLKANAYGQT